MWPLDPETGPLRALVLSPVVIVAINPFISRGVNNRFQKHNSPRLFPMYSFNLKMMILVSISSVSCSSYCFPNKYLSLQNIYFPFLPCYKDMPMWYFTDPRIFELLFSPFWITFQKVQYQYSSKGCWQYSNVPQKQISELLPVFFNRIVDSTRRNG